MSLTASHSQNTRTKKVNLSLPTLNASMERIYPFVKRNGQKKGFIKIIANAHSIYGSVNNKEIPVIGLVAAGSPTLAEENIEKRIPCDPKDSLSSKVDYYLRVKGDSMVDVGIYEDDLIGVNKNNPIKVGSIVVARIGEEVTVKTLESLSSAEVILKAENTTTQILILIQKETN